MTNAAGDFSHSGVVHKTKIPHLIVLFKTSFEAEEARRLYSRSIYRTSIKSRNIKVAGVATVLWALVVWTRDGRS